MTYGSVQSAWRVEARVSGGGQKGLQEARSTVSPRQVVT